MNLYVAKEWQGGSGQWYVNNTDDLGNGSGYWGHLLKIFQVDVDNLVKLLTEKFEVNQIQYNIKSDVLIFSWDTQTAARKFKNALNKAARDRKYFV